MGKKTAQGPERSQGLVRLPTDPPSLFMGLKQRGGRGNPRREPPVAGFLLGGWRGSTPAKAASHCTVPSNNKRGRLQRILKPGGGRSCRKST